MTPIESRCDTHLAVPISARALGPLTALAATHCVFTPDADQLVGSASQAVDFSGVVESPSATVEVLAGPDAESMTTPVTSTVSGQTVSQQIGDTSLYDWSVSATIPAPLWTESTETLGYGCPVQETYVDIVSEGQSLGWTTEDGDSRSYGRLFAPPAEPCAPGDYVFTEIAREFTGGLIWLDADVEPAITDDGTVSFVGTAWNDFDDQTIFLGDGGALGQIDPGASGLEDVSRVQVADSGHVAFRAKRLEPRFSPLPWVGLYAAQAGGAATTLYEGHPDFINVLQPDELPPAGSFAMAPNGTILLAAIINGNGRVHRGPVTGPLAEILSGPSLYNHQSLDVNGAGVGAIQFEHTDPLLQQLRRGVFIVDTPNQPIAQMDSAAEKMGVGSQPRVAINNLGQVALSFPFATQVGYEQNGTPVFETVPAGIVLVNPAPVGTQKVYTQVIDLAAGPYASILDFDFNDAGTLVFHATLDEGVGPSGIFTGPDPVADKVVQVGDVLGGALFSWLEMGDLNDNGELAIFTSDFNTTDRQVWRVEGL